MLPHLGSWILLLLFTCITPRLSQTDGSCIFDVIKTDEVVSTEVNYSENSGSAPHNERTSRVRRAASFDELFAPIRISTFFFQMDLSDADKERLRAVIWKSVSLIEKLFSVIRVKGALLLNRNGCRYTLEEGPNAGKCNQVKRGYQGEFCADEFQIPDDHLKGLAVWDSTHTRPTSVLFADGSGVNDTDFILYVQSLPSYPCVAGELNIIAYATYCQLDQFGRPIAGYINICPGMIRRNSFKDDKVSVTVLHELFHALGFSADLFEQFKECSMSGNGSINCLKSRRIFRNVGGVTHLITPKVYNLTSEHFGCRTGVGPMLQMEGGQVKSHWDAAFMQGSLMTPTISQPHLTFLDKITLAVFEDSGWYRVNYSYAQEFYWGKGEGCRFSFGSDCSANPDYFCQQSSVGCHYLHKDRGMCSTNPFLRGCKIYDPTPEDSCQLQSGNRTDAFGEQYGNASRCFFSNLTQESENSQPLLEGRCYAHRCNATGHLFVGISGDWWLCPEGETIQVPGWRGVISCPSSEVLCKEQQTILNLPVSSGNKSDNIAGSSTTSSVTEDVLEVEIVFESLPLFAENDSLLEEQLFEEILAEVHRSTDVPLERHLMAAVNSGNFSINFFGLIYKAEAVRRLPADVSHPPHETSSAPHVPVISSPSGYISVIAIVCVIGVVIFAVIFALVLHRVLHMKRHKTTRSLTSDGVVNSSSVV